MVGQDADAGGLDEGVGEEGLDVGQGIGKGGFYKGVAGVGNGLLVAAAWR